jgi:choline-sulfatase
MRLLYVDIDTLRADHLGCYGYHRNTSPAIDAIARDAIRFESVYASDTPCGPSRSALISGRFGIHNGVVGHGGTAADPFLEGAARGFQSRWAATSWARRMRSIGMHTATISTFGERHSAYHWDAGFNEVINLGTMGIETADQVAPLAMDWLDRNGARDNWFLHVHLWDPHTPYRTTRQLRRAVLERSCARLDH